MNHSTAPFYFGQIEERPYAVVRKYISANSAASIKFLLGPIESMRLLDKAIS
jgi:hypothetical protein